MQENLQNYKHREQGKKEEIILVVDGESHCYAEKINFISEQEIIRRRGKAENTNISKRRKGINMKSEKRNSNRGRNIAT